MSEAVLEAIDAPEAILERAATAWRNVRRHYRDGCLRVGGMLQEFIAARVREGDGKPEATRLERRLTREWAVKDASSRLGMRTGTCHELVRVAMAVRVLSEDGEVGRLSYQTLRKLAVLVERVQPVCRGIVPEGDSVLPSEGEEWRAKEPAGQAVRLFRRAVEEGWNVRRVVEELRKIPVRRIGGRPRTAEPVLTAPQPAPAPPVAQSVSPAPAARKVYTTGQVAKICKVSPRTVSKWFDSGELRGCRIPGSKDRRITPHDLEEFLARGGMDYALENLRGPAGVVACRLPEPLASRLGETLPGVSVRLTFCAAELGAECERQAPAAVVLDAGTGRAEALETARWAAGLRPTPAVLVLWPEDSPPPEMAGVRLLVQPVTAEQVAGALTRGE